MLIHQALVRMQHLQPQQDRRDDTADHNPQRAEPSEEVQRATHVLEQKPDGQQIEEHPKCAANAVVALTALTVHILYRNLADRSAIPTCKRWNEAMHLP